MKDHFKEKAKDWDNHPVRVEIAKKFTEEVKKIINLKKSFHLLDFGCGTGLVGLSLLTEVEKAYMLDNSKAMLSVLKEKVLKNNLSNVKILEGDIENLQLKTNNIDVIVSSMAFHHVKHIPEVLKKFYDILKKDGVVIISDLCEEDGSFHGEGDIHHHGFNLDTITQIFEESNLKVSKIYKYNTIKRPDKDNKIREYEQFVLVAQKI